MAAPFQERAAVAAVVGLLGQCGIEVTSRWIPNPANDFNDTAAREDFDDVDAADMLILWNPEDWATRGTGGRHVEYGYAAARGKQLVIVGSRTNMFHHLDSTRHFADTPALLAWLTGTAA